MEGPFTIFPLFEWMEDDVDHLELVFSRVDGIIHSAFFLARVFSVSGSEFYNLAKHMLVHVSRITESERYLGGAVLFPSQVESDSDEECAML